MIASVWADVNHNAIYIPKLCSVVVNGNVRANLIFLKSMGVLVVVFFGGF